MKDIDTLRVASLQYWLRPIKNFEEFAEQASLWVINAADYKAKVVLFPEYFTLQLFSLHLSALPVPDLVRGVSHLKGLYIELFQKLSQTYEITIIAGSIPAESADKKLIHNECHVFSPNGSHGVQPKLRMTRFEKEDFGVGSPNDAHLKVFEASWGKFAVAICYDVEFPEIVRAAALQGALVLFVPSCTDDRQGYYRVRYCAQARAIENQMYVVQSSTVGGLSRFPAACLNYGQAAILTPSDYGFARDGILAEGVANTETMIVGDLNLKQLRESRANGTVLPLHDAQSGDLISQQVEIVRL
ncbi:MAG: carbon-nitrogen hydrolase family protein [Bdellovibrionales bacterium]|nr:carbon-nitrogen hydrolase family protein [Oligoflexia bacterium]